MYKKIQGEKATEIPAMILTVSSLIIVKPVLKTE
jgi:hypothetical protein